MTSNPFIYVYDSATPNRNLHDIIQPFLLGSRLTELVDAWDLTGFGVSCADAADVAGNCALFSVLNNWKPGMRTVLLYWIPTVRTNLDTVHRNGSFTFSVMSCLLLPRLLWTRYGSDTGKRLVSIYVVVWECFYSCWDKKVDVVVGRHWQ